MEQKFTLTNHAEKRLQERYLPNPNEVYLVIAKGKAKKQIKECCKENGYNKNLVYWRTNKIPFVVFVCNVIGISKYIVITGFRMDSNLNQP